ncbi:MAG: DEAD/DEAH box helicase family protein [Marinagarivorans sp.]
MRLRSWQTRCINHALSVYKSGQRHFLSVATPGAGKTGMASTLAKRLFQDDLIDLVICLTPSQVVKASFIQDLSTVTGRSMSGGLGPMDVY